MASLSAPARALRRLERLLPAQTGPDGRVVVLLYHAIHPEHPFASARPAQFADHLAWLRAECDVVPLRDIPARAANPGSGTTVAITFDDGFVTDYEYALPELALQQLPATFFITTGLVEGSLPVIDRFARLLSASRDQINGLNWSQVRELHDAGMEIGAHTVTHPNMTVVDGEIAVAEMRHAKDQLEQKLGQEVTSFAYPYGKPKHNVNRKIVELTAQAGFDMAVTVHFRGVRSTDSPLQIPRFAVVGDDVETLQAKVEGRWDLLGAWQGRAPRWLSHALSPHNSHRSEVSLISV